MANWEHCPAVERADERDGGLWVFKGTSVPLYALYETLADGGSVDDFADRFGVTVEQAAGALRYEADELYDYRLDRPDGEPFFRAAYRKHAPADDALWKNCPALEQATGRVGGAWVFLNTRLPLWAMQYELAGGTTIAEFVDWYAGDKVKVKTVLRHAVSALRVGQEQTTHAHSA